MDFSPSPRFRTIKLDASRLFIHNGRNTRRIQIKKAFVLVEYSHNHYRRSSSFRRRLVLHWHRNPCLEKYRRNWKSLGYSWGSHLFSNDPVVDRRFASDASTHLPRLRRRTMSSTLDCTASSATGSVCHEWSPVSSARDRSRPDRRG